MQLWHGRSSCLGICLLFATEQALLANPVAEPLERFASTEQIQEMKPVLRRVLNRTSSANCLDAVLYTVTIDSANQFEQWYEARIKWKKPNIVLVEYSAPHSNQCKAFFATRVMEAKNSLSEFPSEAIYLDESSLIWKTRNGSKDVLSQIPVEKIEGRDSDIVYIKSMQHLLLLKPYEELTREFACQIHRTSDGRLAICLLTPVSAEITKEIKHAMVIINLIDDELEEVSIERADGQRIRVKVVSIRRQNDLRGFKLEKP